ncbi:protein of unknown function [Methanoculleus bourgensis]|uniref:Uncharacterized protein n=1 Tax=Methanoculleus bourgensis TaxID=83986 RepID=A0A0X3BN45_9EURY|nr:protein of unknown function [Methanoculleus bourgensis]
MMHQCQVNDKLSQ